MQGCCTAQSAIAGEGNKRNTLLNKKGIKMAEEEAKDETITNAEESVDTTEAQEAAVQDEATTETAVEEEVETTEEENKAEETEAEAEPEAEPVAEEATEEAEEATAETEEETAADTEEKDDAHVAEEALAAERAALAEERAALAEEKAEMAFIKLCEEGKLVPAQKEAYKALASKGSVEVAFAEGKTKTISELLNELVESAPAHSLTNEEGEDGEGDKTETVVTDEDKEVAERFGNTVEELQNIKG